MPFKRARNVWSVLRPARAGSCCGIAALLLVIGCDSLQNATAEGDTRALTLKHSHTGETATITFKVNGRYDQDALSKLNHLLRDWREDKSITMDPHLFDLIWEVYREVEATEPITVVCGYRSPGTNAMLRRRSSGVAKFSQHMNGKAMDFYIPGVPLDRLREAGLRAQRGGVGYYQSSNFVHLDTGSVRHWPRMPEAQLARVLAKGPLTRFASKDSAPASPPVQTAAFKFSNPLAKLFGGGEDEAAETAAEAAVVAEAKTQKTAPKSVIAAAVPTPPARPKTQAVAQSGTLVQPATFEVASASSRTVELRPAQTASLVTRSAQPAGERSAEPSLTPPAEVPEATRRMLASADPTGTVAPWQMPEREPTKSAALAYAPATQAASVEQPRPSATSAPMVRTGASETTVAVKRSVTQTAQAGAAPAVRVPVPPKAGQRFNDPWMRAMIVAPSAGEFMSTSLMGEPDYRELAPQLHKPASTVMMTFADDPYLGMRTEKFSGSAVVFVSTVTFPQRTASLR